ncbi:hypothetical protein EDD22DRAFT_851999 [Suillus occidentalis]|nr:hypothetical protein EDD22DRAFT_851999 [Suillus occidentalis]
MQLPSKRRKETERASKQRSMLFWYDSDDVPVMMKRVVHCPYYPQYQLIDDPALVQSLGDNVQKIDIFEEGFMRWIPSTLSHTFTLGSGCQIFIRRHGVTQCSEFDELLRSSKLLIQSPHMRFNIKGESNGVRRKKRQHLAISPSPTPSQTETWSTSSASSGVIPVHVPIYKPAKKKVWPHAMYTIDMASWLETEPTILEMHKKAGRTPDGLWSNYLAARSRALGDVNVGLI